MKIHMQRKLLCPNVIDECLMAMTLMKNHSFLIFSNEIDVKIELNPNYAKNKN